MSDLSEAISSSSYFKANLMNNSSGSSQELNLDLSISLCGAWKPSDNVFCSF